MPKNTAGLDKTKLITADILGQATAMGVRLNDNDATARDNLMREVLASTDEELTPGETIDIDNLPDEDADQSATVRTAQSLEEEADQKFFEPQLPDDVKEELDAPDFDAMAEEEMSQHLPAQEYEQPRFEDTSYQMEPSSQFSDWEDLDQEVLEERKKRIAAEKKAAWLEGLRMKSEQKRWAAEAQEHFPLAGAAIKSGYITARSRKDYLRQARDAHQNVLPYVKESIRKRDEVLNSERQKVKEETREEFIKAWGRPTTGPSQYTPRNDYSKDLADSRKKGDLARSIGILRKQAEQGQGEEE